MRNSVQLRCMNSKSHQRVSRGYKPMYLSVHHISVCMHIETKSFIMMHEKINCTADLHKFILQTLECTRYFARNTFKSCSKNEPYSTEERERKTIYLNFKTGKKPLPDKKPFRYHLK